MTNKLPIPFSILLLMAFLSCSLKNENDRIETMEDRHETLKERASDEDDDKDAGLKPEGTIVKPSCIVFIGYDSGNPIFKDCDKTLKTIYKYENSILHVFHRFQDNLMPLFCVNEGIIFLRKSEKYSLYYEKDGEGYPLNTQGQITLAIADKDFRHLAYYDEATESATILDLEKGVTIGSLEGAVPRAIDSDNLYYETGSTVDGLINVFKASIRDHSTKEQLVGNIFGEHLTISPDGNYIACSMPINGEPNYAIYSIAKRKFHIFNDDALNSDNYYPIFYKDGNILFYRPNNPEFIVKAIPANYDYAPK